MILFFSYLSLRLPDSMARVARMDNIAYSGRTQSYYQVRLTQSHVPCNERPIIILIPEIVLAGECLAESDVAGFGQIWLKSTGLFHSNILLFFEPYMPAG
jgi:hypothetical protein